MKPTGKRLDLPPPAPALEGLLRIVEPGPDESCVLLDRNERLGPFPEAFLASVRAELTSALVQQYPSQEPVLARLEATLGLPRERILLTSGSDAGVKAAFHAYARPGDPIVALEPSYAMYAVYAKLFQARFVPIPFGPGLELDEEKLLLAIAPPARLVVLANPNQPTGTVLRPGLLETVLDRAAEAGALVLVDEAYFPFSGETAVPLLDANPHLVVLRSLSKAAGLAGLRIGYALGHRDVIANLFKVRSVFDVNAMALACARAVLDEPSIVSSYVAAVAEGGRTLAAAATRLGLTPLPTHANFMLLRVAARAEPGALVERLRGLGYRVKGPFAAPCLADCIRVTLGPPALMEDFARALERALAAPSWVDHPELVRFYASHRNKPEDLYPSERRFVPYLAREASSVLDTGCAAGGFLGIWRHHAPGIRYTGADVSRPAIETARARNPGERFLVADVARGLALEDRHADVVTALGWLHESEDYARAIGELWRLTRRFLFLDLRLLPAGERAVVGRQKLALTGEWDGKTETPYVTVPWPSLVPLLLALRPARILGYGYRGPPASTVSGVASEVCFAAFVLERGKGDGEPTVCLDLPLEWPRGAPGKVLPASELARLVPAS